MSAPTSYAPGARPPWRVARRPALAAGPASRRAGGRHHGHHLVGPAGAARGLRRSSARQAIQAALDEVVAEMSTWEDHSDITGYNRAGPGWHALPAGFWHVLTHALALAEESGGA